MPMNNTVGTSLNQRSVRSSAGRRRRELPDQPRHEAVTAGEQHDQSGLGVQPAAAHCPDGGEAIPKAMVAIAAGVIHAAAGAP